MKKLFQKLKDLILDKTDTWDNHSSNLPVQRIQNNNIHREPQNNQPPHGFSPFEWREQITENEFAAENCTRQNQSVNVFGPSTGGNIPCSHSNESFTEEGLVSGKTEALLTTAEGRLIKPNELHGGGQCSNCIELTDKIYFCAVCKVALCLRCVKKYKELHVCQKHLKELKFKEDTWSLNNE